MNIKLSGLFAVVLISLVMFFNGLCTAGIRSWDKADSWNLTKDKQCAAILKVLQSPEKMVKFKYKLRPDGGWAAMNIDCEKLPSQDIPVVFDIKAKAESDLEIKFIDTDGSVFIKRFNISGKYQSWTTLVVSLKNLEYVWGGRNDTFDGMAQFGIAMSGGGQGTVWIKNIVLGNSEMKLSFPHTGQVFDPYREMKGFGTLQRRDEKMNPEELLVLQYLKCIQDTSSEKKQLLPSMEGFQAQTFNNALVAMAFILKGEQERAERILDFYMNATDTDNQNPTLQNFYYKGQARGFFQHVAIRDCYSSGGSESANLHKGNCNVDAYNHLGDADRWMGDMAWLLIAYEYHKTEYKSQKYEKIRNLLRDLLISWYKDVPAGGGYVQHGWRNGDRKLHEDHGHHEGNIDCYALFRLLGEDELADKIKIWLVRELNGRKNLPLDLYTWRVLAYGDEVSLLNIPEYDLRYRKTLTVNGRKVTGFYHSPDIETDNIWLDGTGHIACAFIVYGDKYRGYFYANQLDALLIDREINGVKTRAFPYTANSQGGFEWVDFDKGFVSVCAWYIFSKNSFNPMDFRKH